MKNFIKVFLIISGFIISFNTAGFALVDEAASCLTENLRYVNIAAWGGFGFNGNQKGNSGADVDAYNYGIKGFYNKRIPFFQLSIGPYYQISPISIEHVKNDRKSFGLDVEFALYSNNFEPYLRGTYSLWDKIDGCTDNFKSFGTGIGASYYIIYPIAMFCEFMYENINIRDTKITMMYINFGLEFAI